MRTLSAVVVWCSSLAACGKSEVVPFPEGLAPLPDPIPACPADRSETIELDSERTEGWFSARGCGFVAADLATTLDAVQTPEVGVHRRVINFDDCVVTDDVEPEYEVSYAVDTLVRDILDVRYTLTWRHGQVDETTWATHWLMTTTSPFVPYIEGSAVVVEDGDLVRFEVVERIDAAIDDEEEAIVGFLSDFHASVVAVAHGRPLPEWPAE